MAFGLQPGVAAMTSIKRITAGRLSYSEELPQRAPQEELPPTPELLTLLGGGMAPDAADDGGPSAGTVATSLNRSRAILETELVEYLGPMARVVCNEHLTRAARGGSASSCGSKVVCVLGVAAFVGLRGAALVLAGPPAGLGAARLSLSRRPPRPRRPAARTSPSRRTCSGVWGA